MHWESAEHDTESKYFKLQRRTQPPGFSGVQT